MGVWRRILHFLTHDRALESARAERARIEAAIDALASEFDAELVGLVKLTLFHQGEPRAHVARLRELVRARRSYGWDEADYEFEGDRVRISFLASRVEVGVDELAAVLERIASFV